MHNLNRGRILPIKTNSEFSSINTKSANLRDMAEGIYSEINVEKKLNLSDKLFVNVSHDIRSPLNIIYSAAQLIELYAKNDEEGEKIASNINLIKRNTHRLIKVINNVLDSQKSSLGLFKPEYSYVNIVAVIDEMMECVVEEIMDKQLEIVFDTDIEEEYVMMDVGCIVRVLLNIISYSLKNFKPEVVKVNLSVNHSKVEIEVSCLKIKFVSNRLENIFNRKAFDSIAVITESNELGLKLSRLFVESHGGSINYLSKSSSNRIFTIKLPRRKQSNVTSLFHSSVLNDDALREMIKIEFSDID